MNRLLLILGSTFCLSISVFAQRNCGTMENYNRQIEKEPALKLQYENALKQIISSEKSLQRNAGSVITIPVVVHVIHDNEAVGTGTNISDAQIQSQIDALNEDFRLNNADSLTPSHPFWQYQSDVQIEFCLARQTPGGLPSTGIERIYGGVDWTMSDCDQFLKPQTIWDRSRFLNLWTVDWGGANEDLLGYAQFPGGAATTDGVVIGYGYFGYLGNVNPPYDYGRTATHEIGHWLGLRHIWGDATCGDDLISDTPPQEQDNSGCPSFPHNAFNICGTTASGEMFMNYMDYVEDRCMVMFTNQQAIRMNSAMNNQRSSLITSNGCSTPNRGIDENSLFGESISIYPNPSTGILRILYSDLKTDQMQIQVTDLSGRCVRTFSAVNSGQNSEIDLSDLNSGTYLIRFSQKNLNTIKKLTLIR